MIQSDFLSGFKGLPWVSSWTASWLVRRSSTGFVWKPPCAPIFPSGSRHPAASPSTRLWVSGWLYCGTKEAIKIVLGLPE
jgi:hypothetical protein